MSEELIKKSDAIKAVAEYISCDYATEEMATESATLLIDTIPTIEPKRGKWIDLDDQWGFEGTIKCSACGELWSLIDGTPQDNGMNFCPNCGADMRGKDDE